MRLRKEGEVAAYGKRKEKKSIMNLDLCLKVEKERECRSFN